MPTYTPFALTLPICTSKWLKLATSKRAEGSADEFHIGQFLRPE